MRDDDGGRAHHEELQPHVDQLKGERIVVRDKVLCSSSLASK